MHVRNAITIRPLASGDAPALHAAVQASIASLSHWFPWAHAGYALSDAEARIAHCTAARARGEEFAFGIFAADGELLGCVGLNQVNRAHHSANLGYWIGEAHRGRGMAADAARQVATTGFGELGLVRIEIVTLPDNAASQRVAQKLGATREGEFRNRLVVRGEPADAVVFSLVPGDLERA
ncbi:GNAT family N-acetyltransferase [Pseudoluteimonas lycopersici]|uniref:GNAT family N-acetyltransferase n=1 Tax=Pseudoluteimonas lycopersici TaxID=1324796 RepID=A0A516V225_9GAMM|nr:GNAT family N-acetyltransferase [Lysobacter lycopersici]